MHQYIPYILLLSLGMFGITTHAQIGISPTTSLILDHRGEGLNRNVWKTSSGMYPTSGGIAFGFFSDPFSLHPGYPFGNSLINPNVWFVNDILTNYQLYGRSLGEALYFAGFRDFRSFSPYGLVQTSGDWSFSSNPTNDGRASGNIFARTDVLDASLSNSLSGVRLFEIAFGFGEWNSETNDIRDASFGGDNWGIVSRANRFDPAENYEFPSSPGLKTLRFDNLQEQSFLQSPEFVGTIEFSSYPYNNVLMIPEPSSLSLLVAGGAVLMARRRKL